jgi:hypothetical protein
MAHRKMNVEIGAEAALFPEKEYICGIFVTVPHAPPSKRIDKVGYRTGSLCTSCFETEAYLV